jgi:hypothetical protein
MLPQYYVRGPGFHAAGTLGTGGGGDLYHPALILSEHAYMSESTAQDVASAPQWISANTGFEALVSDGGSGADQTLPIDGRARSLAQPAMHYWPITTVATAFLHADAC